jgi:hypothetical protein
MNALFLLSNLLVIPFWLLMIAAPRWRWTGRLMASPWVVAPVALLYALLVLPQLPDLLASLATPTLAAVAALLSRPEAALLAWAHFVAMDLFAGRWAYLDSQARDMPVWLASPLLFLILMLGPLGLFLYLVARTFVSPPLEKTASP